MERLMTMPSDLANVSARINFLLELPQARRLVAEYFNEALSFAGTMFDRLGQNPQDQITNDDLLAVSLLDVGFPPLALRGLARESLALSYIPTGVPLWEASDDLLGGWATTLWDLLVGTDGIGSVKASKLMARKRPLLISIVDIVVIATIGTSWKECWRDIRATLLDADRRERIEALRPEAATSVTTLRLLDSLIWMYGSESTSAREVRAAGTCPSSLDKWSVNGPPHPCQW